MVPQKGFSGTRQGAFVAVNQYHLCPRFNQGLGAGKSNAGCGTGDGGHLAVQLTIEPLALSATRLSSMLSVDGQLIPYQHGAPQRTGLVWPNSLGNSNGSQLTLVHSTGNTASPEQAQAVHAFLRAQLGAAQSGAAQAQAAGLAFHIAGVAPAKLGLQQHVRVQFNHVDLVVGARHGWGQIKAADGSICRY